MDTVNRCRTLQAFPSVEVPLLLTEATLAKFGDYQCNSAMSISAVSGKRERERERERESEMVISCRITSNLS